MALKDRFYSIISIVNLCYGNEDHPVITGAVYRRIRAFGLCYHLRIKAESHVWNDVGCVERGVAQGGVQR